MCESEGGGVSVLGDRLIGMLERSGVAGGSLVMKDIVSRGKH